MRLYLAVTPDEYELPLFVADSAKEMAAWHGCYVESLRSMMSRQKRQPRDLKVNQTKVLFYSVEVEDDDEEE